MIVGCAAALLLITLAIQVAGAFSQTAALRKEVIRSYETRAELQRILSFHQDLETGQRGYVLTGDTRFLEPYEDAPQMIDATFALVETRWLAGSPLLSELARTRRLSALKRRFSEQTVLLTERGQVARARAQIASGEGKRLMDAVRAGISKIDHHERAHLASRTLLFDQAQAKLQKLLVALGTVLVALLAAAIFFLIRAYLGWERTLNRERDLGARQEAIFEAARDGMIVVNASGSIESLNPAAARMFGFEAAELLRRDVGMLFEIAPDRGRIETFLKRLSAHRARSLSDTQEFIGRCKDGSLFPAEVSVSPVLLKSTTRFLAVLRDVSERKQVEQMKTEFVSIVSHELRTPLTSISGSLGLIVGGAAGELPARAKRLVEIAQTNCARLVRLINDILDIEKIESGRMVFDIKPISLDRLLNEAVEANGQFAADHGVELRVEPPPPKASIFGDEDRMMQVLTNLLSNATKFSAPGSIVHVSVTPLDRFYRISVADQGSGISPEFRDRIFTKFAQADSSDTRQKSGTGLGLSIVREIITRLGGSISFESEPGRGTVFHVDLPAAYSSEDADRPVHALGRVDDIQGAVVLHVDDDPDMLRVVATALEGRAEVRSTPSVVEARASIRRYAFDAVILDIAMADGDGLDLIPDIKKRDGTGIIVFTAQEAPIERLEGADLVLIKSRDSLDRLVAEVERLTERSGQGSEA